MWETLSEICNIATAAGAEDGILSYFEEHPILNAEYMRDGMGNLIVAKKCGKSGAKKIMVCAKADCDGFIVNYIEENGYLRITKLGNPNVVSSAYSEIVFENGTKGFIVPEKGADLKDDALKLFVDIGAKNRAEAQNFVALGDVCRTVPNITALCGEKAGGSGLSVKAGMEVLLKLMNCVEAERYDLYFAVTGQDSLRHRGAKVAAFDIEPDICFCVEECESFDVIGAERKGGAVLGDGAVLIAKAANYCANPKFLNKLEEIAERENVKHAVCVYDKKNVAASVISKCGKGVPCVVLGIPTRNISSNSEILDIGDVRNVFELIAALLCEKNIF